MMANFVNNYTSDSSDSDNSNKVIDLAYLLLDPQTVEKNLENFLHENEKNKGHLEIESMNLHHNQLVTFPESISRFIHLKILDVSNNGLTELPDIARFCPLTTLIAKNNCLKNDSLPKSFHVNHSLKEFNLSGNLLSHFPEQLLEFVNLKYLYLGGNKINTITKKIYKLSSIQILCLGGNELTEVPFTLGHLKNLQALVLCDNQIETLPSNIANLHNLKSLQLHKNKLKTLPPEILALKNLTELSLRDNPLVVRFVTDMSYSSASLLELTARSVKLFNIVVNPGDIPKTLLDYLNSAHRCVNPNCKGVYFDDRVEHVKFVDFCGKYRIPLLQYLCSSKCRRVPDEEHPMRQSTSSTYLMKKVLLG